ncbi:MAG: hypothetical protein A2X05_18525 [Bacteroidetes bacterium GWE2_41_25]|nr:MAG: hypothetical protein A2X03_16630 [Bacteroidetes bacterium GWA2_40_15]OFX96652.1 MAG: hypothetical protein A2X05_18525 [Bacteroidetes bacterium GWE2_41_25]OFX97724.1 MAG: hypothetical protein A2X06_13320 [Bacteroidetes bacterium GWC2_40_22]OFY58413.1 MAG: hypothetical protein A2X04_06740 [Bacteroidetes bacterium GWF2_41_9]HAM10144.1 hypothetical protein [Bacteroidales bacterium]
MKKTILWILTIVITLGAAYYQRKTGPTHPKQIIVNLNDTIYKLKLVRSIALDERSEIRMNINDPSINARLHFKRLNVEEDYQTEEFSNDEKGLFAPVPQQPAAGKLEYYIEISDSKGTQVLFKESPIVIRFKGGVPGFILVPHILFMFVAMLFSTLAGLMALTGIPLYKKYAIWTLILFTAGGMILGPVVQYYAFGDLWTGVPFGWDLTDNKTLISFLFWILAVFMNRKTDKPIYTIIAAVVLLMIYSIPHSLFGSQLDYESGQVTQGMILNLF